MTRPLAIALCLLLSGALLPAPARAGDARRALEEGLVLYAARNYEQAAAKFEEAAAKAADEGLDQQTAAYDRASALLKAGKADEAAAIFATAVRTTDEALREKAHFNRGNALVAAADARAAAADPAGAIGLLGQALDEYESAMRLAPDDEDPKVNHELAARKRARLEERQSKPQPREQPGSARPDQGARPPEPAPARAAKEMTPDEALTLLDAMRQHEASQRQRLAPGPDAATRVDKDW
jgi:tetratricopeptide (TPR) repeat protein